MKTKNTLEKLIGDWNILKDSFIRYTLAQTTLNGAVILSQTRGDFVAAGEDAFTNLPFFAVVNLGYAKGVDYMTRKLGKYGRIGANAFSLGVTGAFYTYALMTNDTDPAIPSAVAGAIGIVLTNKQVNEIRSQQGYNIEERSLD
ncbi:MAG: hypothetical protein KAS15_08880 [Nanoarchaeota archaeon]|nr:hypothetical protein [Nanoarchaeota archaeon]